ncbi:MAG: transposase [Anaerolineae bacterium]|nr:transposase [Anaerolineae bacterium]
MGIKTFKYRLYPTAPQERLLYQTLNVCRAWYNMCLEERKLAWEVEGRSVTKSQQEKTAVCYGQTFPQALVVFSQTMQSVCDDLDKAFQAFFRRVKAGETPGYPRFHSFAFKQFGVGAKLDGRRLKLFGVGRVAVRWHRRLKGDIKTVRILHKAGRWWACDVPDKPHLPKTGHAVGLDLGLSALLTTSDGDQVEDPHFYRKTQARLRVLQGSLARKPRRSKHRHQALLRLQHWHEHIGNQRRNFAHKLTTALVQGYDQMALEDLCVANMARNPRLGKHILDAGWSVFRELLTNKAVDAGRQVVFVHPAYTSQTCSGCGTRFQAFDLSVRWVECACDLSLNRDHNAAINILNKAGWDAPVSPNVNPLSSPSGKGKVMRAAEATRL